MTIDPAVPGIMLIVGLVLLLVAVAGLTAFQARTDPHVTWAAFAVPAIGLVVFSIGSFGMLVTGDDYFGLALLGVMTGDRGIGPLRDRDLPHGGPVARGGGADRRRLVRCRSSGSR